MRLLATIRRVQAPLVCLAVACVLSVGCRSSADPVTVRLGEPRHAYFAEDGTLMFGYHVERKDRPKHSGWHWLIIGPEVVELLTEPEEPSPDTHGVDLRYILVKYSGEDANAGLLPGLLEPGLASSAPPKWTQNEPRPAMFVWDSYLGGPRLIDPCGANLPLMLVTPGTMVIYPKPSKASKFWKTTLAVVAMTAMFVGYVALKGLLDDDEDDEDDWD